jgi:hypothetical protein
LAQKRYVPVELLLFARNARHKRFLSRRLVAQSLYRAEL